MARATLTVEIKTRKTVWYYLFLLAARLGWQWLVAQCKGKAIMTYRTKSGGKWSAKERILLKSHELGNPL